MTPSARLEAVVEILQGLETTAQPADRFLRDWFRARRYAGSKDRAAIAERAFAILRRRSSSAWRMGRDDARALVIASLLAEHKPVDEIDRLFDGSGYGPAPLSDEERRAIAALPSGEPPLHVKGEFPEFLEGELRRAFQANDVIPGEAATAARPGTHGDNVPVGPGSRVADATLGRDDSVLLDEMLALQSRAPIDLRVNTLKATREAVLAGLRDEGFEVAPTPWSPHGLRLPPGTGSAKLGATALFTSGDFEFQDEAAQIAALLCGARPGMRVLDLAAGAGGKSLALAAAMRNEGEILAFDDNPERLKPLVERAARAGATCIRIARGGPGDGLFDVVLVDAPCSGTGTWRRQPELRWRTTPDSLARLCQVQDGLLDDGARHTKPGGRLVYATCSVLPLENQDRVAAFLARHPDFAPVPAAEAWHHGAPPPGLEAYFCATPRTTGTDGFFTAVLRRAR